MKWSSYVISFAILTIAMSGKVCGQGMAVNTSGASANGSAMLDVSSTTQGMLVPRMTATQRGSIGTPATGLLVYQTDAPAGFYFYNGSVWTSLSAPTGTAGGNLTGSYPNPTIASLPAISGAALTNLNASALTTGTVSPTVLGSGSASSSTFLRGDNTWATPSGGGGGGGTIGGGIVYTVLPLTTAQQSYTVTTSGGTVGTTNRLYIFEESNDAYWNSNTPSVKIDVGPASLYAAGTIIQFRGVRIPQPYGHGPSWTFVSSGATFLGMNSSSTSGTWSITYFQVEMISDGVSKWYISPY